MVTLLLTEKGGETKQLSFEKDEVTVGRVQGNDIVLPKGNVSKRHCRVMLAGGRFSVEDLKSTNGTYINGRKIGEVTAVGGTDKIYVGDFVIRVDVPGETPPPPTAAPPEAGSLSAALPRRPPPPPAPGRPTGSMPALDDEAAEGRGRGRAAPPPPPAPSGRRDSGVEAVNTMPPEPIADLPPLGEPDEEVLSARPRLQVPPLKSPRPLLSDDASRGLDDDVLTSQRDRDRDRMSATTARPSHGSSHAASHGGAAGAEWLSNLLTSDGATAVYVSGERVEVERNGQREAVTPPSGALNEAVRSLAARGTPRPAGDTRVVNVFLPENARLAAIFPPVAGEMIATIERTAPAGRTLGELVLSGAISADAQALIEACVAGRRNILIGGDGRGLEALLQAVAAAIPTNMRVVTLADVSAPDGATGWTKLSRDTHVPDVVRAAASLRPDYLVVDVTAPGLATDVLSQSVLGQEGSIVAVAARSAGDALARLAALAGPALGGQEHARELAAAAFDVVIATGTLADGQVRLLEVGEPRPGSSGRLDVVTALVWRAGGAGGQGRFEVVGSLPRLAATLAARGLELPSTLGPAGR